MFVKEVELERLNLTRTADEVIAQKIADVQLKLWFADVIGLESTGRIAYDDAVIDASPENAGMYQSLILTGTIPGLHPAAVAGPPAIVGPIPADATSNSQFDAWELAAMTIGAAANKSTPLTIDAVQYYNRIIGFPPDDMTATPPVIYDSPWGVDFVQAEDPENPGAPLAGSERFVDFSSFTYNRSETFKGSVTWLDVVSLTWKVSRITDVVPFTNLSSYDELTTQTLTGLTAFAQLADDVRALCNFVPDNTYIPGYYMDVPGVDTTAAQLRAIHDPAVDLGTLPNEVFQTFPFQMTASLLNPWGGDLIPTALLRLEVDAPASFVVGDVVATAGDGQTIPFTVDSDGDLVGWWGPPTGFAVAPGYNVSTTFEVVIASTAPTGPYNLTLDLVTAGDTTTVLAQDTGAINVEANTAFVLWGGPIVEYATQGTAMAIPIEVYSPAAGTALLTLTIAGPGDDATTPEVVEALVAGDLSVYGSNGADMVSMPLVLDPANAFVGGWDLTVTVGYTPLTWYATVAEGALVGNYTFGVSLDGGNTLDPATIAIAAPDEHGEQPPDSGEDLTPPVVTITAVGTPGSTATFELTANETEVTFECQLTIDATAGAWETCTSPKTYSSLAPASYVFSARGTDNAGNVSATVTRTWTVDEPPVPDTTPPVAVITPVGIPGSSATFELTANEPATYECSLVKNGRAGAWATCPATVVYTNLKVGTYVLSVRATDAAGNVSEIVSSDPWVVQKGGKAPK
jgi:hypothetical protein